MSVPFRPLATGLCASLMATCASTSSPISDRSSQDATLPAAARAPASDLIAGQTEFAFDLYDRLAAEDEGNVFVSPVSISTAFGLLQVGAQGETAREIAGVMRYPDDVTARMAEFAQQVQSDEDGRVFALANAVFVERALALAPAYTRAVREAYNAEVPRVDFASDPAGAEKDINAWVEENTRGLIPKVYDKAVKDNWIMVLVNTAYLKARWEDEFEPGLTRSAPFAASDGPVNVEMMTRRDILPYAEARRWHAVKLPYEGGTMSATFILPKRGGLSGVEAEFGPAMLAEMDAQFAAQSYEDEIDHEEVEVDLYLPRMDIAASYMLGNTLQAMGMQTPFGSGADFDAMWAQSRSNDQIGSVVHKTRLKLDEEGTEAAAVTAISIIATGLRISDPDRRVTFRVDQPVLMLIRDEASGAILFMGRIDDPLDGS